MKKIMFIAILGVLSVFGNLQKAQAYDCDYGCSNTYQSNDCTNGCQNYTNINYHNSNDCNYGCNNYNPNRNVRVEYVRTYHNDYQDQYGYDCDRYGNRMSDRNNRYSNNNSNRYRTRTVTVTRTWNNNGYYQE